LICAETERMRWRWEVKGHLANPVWTAVRLTYVHVFLAYLTTKNSCSEDCKYVYFAIQYVVTVSNPRVGV